MTHDWRRIERVLIEHLNSHGVPVADMAGDPHAEFVRFREADEVGTIKVSLEKLAQLLARAP
jgi:hypothetical protein